MFLSWLVRFTQTPYWSVYLSSVAIAKVERRHEVGVVLLHAGGPLRQLGNLGMMETDQLKHSPANITNDISDYNTSTTSINL